MLSRKFAQTAFKGKNYGLLSRSYTKFTQRTIIRPEQKPFIPYTRQQLKLMRENPSYE
jgi:hypothetical protein